jgi:hypothetical protein
MVVIDIKLPDSTVSKYVCRYWVDKDNCFYEDTYIAEELTRSINNKEEQEEEIIDMQDPSLYE